MSVETLHYYAGWADKITGDTLPVNGPFFAYTLREPVGVIGAIVSLEFPPQPRHLEIRTCLGRRLHGDSEAGERDTTHGAGDG